MAILNQEQNLFASFSAEQEMNLSVASVSSSHNNDLKLFSENVLHFRQK
jgi:hypothetical protein